MSTTRTTYVLQYRSRGSEDWINLSARSTPEEAFGRMDAFRATSEPVASGYLQDLQVVRREITDTVITDPRLAPEAGEAKAVSG